MKTEASWRITAQTNNQWLSHQKNKLDESQPEHLVGVLQSVGEALQYEKRLQRPIETNQTVKTAAERKRKSRSEKERMLLEKGE